MRLVYAILAHDAFDQLERLIHRLLAEAPTDRVCLHIDARVSPPSHFLRAIDPAIRARVKLIARPVRVHWAHDSICTAMERLLDAALEAPFDVVHLLSGRDWPLCSRDAMVNAIGQAPANACFLDIWEDEMAWRMNDWCFITKSLRPRPDPTPISWRIAVARSYLSRQTDALLKRRGMTRSEPIGPWVRGSQWWSLSADAARYSRDVLQNLRTSGRLRFTQASDEHVVQTALANGPFSSRIVPAHRMFTFVDGAWSPNTLTAADLATRPADAWFGRKFDMAVDPAFLDI